MGKNYKSIKIGVFTLSFFFCALFSAQSQVTIGTLSQPVKGALLDLKQQDDLTGNINSSKGVMLPRVLLTDINSLTPMLSGGDLSDATLKLSHTGLVVYNVNTTLPFQEGIYSWDGAKWNFCINVDATSADNGLTMSSDTVKLGGDLNQTTTVGLNNNNLVFDGSAGGDIQITNTRSSYDSSNNYLVVDSAGTVMSRAFIPFSQDYLELNDVVDWSAEPNASIKDFYFVDRIVTITLPAMPNENFQGKLIRFYVYGGSGTNLIIKGVHNPMVTSTPAIPVGFTYSGGNAQGVNGTLTITSPTGASDTNRFRFLDIISDGTQWWVNNR